MEGNSSWRQKKGDIVTISRKVPCSAERKRLQHGGGTGKGLEDCRKASIGVRGSAELWGHDRSLVNKPDLLRAVLRHPSHKLCLLILVLLLCYLPQLLQ